MDESSAADKERLRAALHDIEASQSRGMAGFESIRAHLAASPSPLSDPPWSFVRSARVAWALVVAQCRVASWLVIPVALVSAIFAVLTARLLGAADGSSTAESGFVVLILVGVVLTMAVAVSGRGPDTASVVTPVGPASVLLARVTMIFALDCAAGLAASWLATARGPLEGLGSLVLAWFVPMVAVAGVATLLAVWVSPWVAGVVGVMVVPVLAPAPEGMMRVGVGAVIGAVGEALPALALVSVGVASFVAALLLARRTAVANATS